MKTLVYFTSIGEKYAALTQIAVNTLITNGQYTGAIKVFCDDYFKSDNKQVEIIKINPSGSYHLCNCKLFCLLQIDFSQYDQILFLDSDIEVVKNIYPLFTADNCLLYAEEPWQKIKNQGFKDPCTSLCFSEAEYKEFAERQSINSGQFCFDARLGHKLLYEWFNIFSKTSMIFGAEQSALALLVFKQIIPVKRFEPEIVWFYGIYNVPQLNAIFIHYLTDAKRVLLQKYGHTDPEIINTDFNFPTLVKMGTVSCLCVTRKPDSIQHAIDQYEAQTYHNKELIIIADNKQIYEKIKIYINPYKSIYIYPPTENTTLGEKRNLAVSLAHGEYLVNWDDDDISAPTRIAEQLFGCINSGMDACYLSDMKIYFKDENKSYNSLVKKAGWEPTMLCKKSAITKYANAQKGEDTPVLNDFAFKIKNLSISGTDLFTYVWDGQNVWDKIHFKSLCKK